MADRPAERGPSGTGHDTAGEHVCGPDCQCGCAAGLTIGVPRVTEAAPAPRRYLIDTGVAIHLPQTPRIEGRKTARSIHGYFGDVVTREQAKRGERVACPRCFPHGWE